MAAFSREYTPAVSVERKLLSAWTLSGPISDTKTAQFWTARFTRTARVTYRRTLGPSVLDAGSTGDGNSSINEWKEALTEVASMLKYHS